MRAETVIHDDGGHLDVQLGEGYDDDGFPDELHLDHGRGTP